MVFLKILIKNSRRQILSEKIFNFPFKKTIFVGSGGQSDIKINKSNILDVHVIIQYAENNIIISAIGNNIVVNGEKIMQKSRKKLEKKNNFCIKIGYFELHNYSNYTPKNFIELKNTSENSIRINLNEKPKELYEQIENEENIYKEIFKEANFKESNKKTTVEENMNHETINEILNSEKEIEQPIQLPNIENLKVEDKKTEDEKIEVRETDTKISPKKKRKRKILRAPIKKRKK